MPKTCHCQSKHLLEVREGEKARRREPQPQKQEIDLFLWIFSVCSTFFFRKIRSRALKLTRGRREKEDERNKPKTNTNMTNKKMTEPVLLRVKLPPSSPVISKTFKVPPDSTVHSAVNDVIGKSLQQTISVTSNYGVSFCKYLIHIFMIHCVA